MKAITPLSNKEGKLRKLSYKKICITEEKLRKQSKYKLKRKERLKIVKKSGAEDGGIEEERKLLLETRKSRGFTLKYTFHTHAHNLHFMIIDYRCMVHAGISTNGYH